MNDVNNSISVLFFGRKGDIYSIKCHKHLLDLDFDVTVVWSSKRGEKLPQEIYLKNYDYIFCFRSYFILPRQLLESVNFECINFHPGPPEHPGSRGINFSLYNNDSIFGITVHLMDEKVDSGKILFANYFPIVESDDLKTLLNKTHNELLSSFKEFTIKLKKFGYDFILQKITNDNELSWSHIKRNIQDVNKFQIIDKNIDQEELRRRIRGFNYPGYPLEVKLHDISFSLNTRKINNYPKKKIVLIGGGGHCKSVIDVIELSNQFDIVGIVDKPNLIGSKVLGYPVIGDDSDLFSLAKKYQYALVTVGQIRSSIARIRLFNLAVKSGFKLPSIVSPRAYVSNHSSIGNGSVIMHDVQINSGSYIGENCIINSGSLIEHDCKIYNNTHVSTNVTVNGAVTIKEECFIGSGVITNNGITIKKNSFIKAGSIVK
jgi:sugar O-acyltransferase (sialic acid O-acetyltransferase NeuD family)